MANLSDKLSSLQFTPKPQSPAFAGAVVNVPLAQVSKYQEKNYFLCDGSEYSETTYAELFAACGTQYNTGGETAGFFRVPNGPRQTKRVDLSSYFSSADNGGTLTEMYGFAEQKLDGKWYVTLWGQGTKTNNITGTILTFDSGTFNFEETTFPIGSYNVQNMLARTNAPDSIQTGTNPGNYGYWFISISDSPCTSAPSWADANLAFQPMIKVYDDASNISMSLADATATKTGAIRLDSSFAAGAGVYGLVKVNGYVFKVDENQRTTSVAGVEQITNVPQGKYRVTVGYGNSRVDSNVQAYIEPQLNGSVIQLGSSVAWQIGNIISGSLSGENNIVPSGNSGVQILDFPNATNTFELDITIGTNCTISRPYYILEKLENYIDVGTDWD